MTAGKCSQRRHGRGSAHLPGLLESTFAADARGLISILALLLAALAVPSAHAQSGAKAEITAPLSGEVVRGEVGIRGTAYSAAFLAAELAFAYASDQTDTWFVIAEVSEAVTDGELAIWDTNGVSDGDYMLRLQLSMRDGTKIDAFVEVQVRNYTSPTLPTPAASQTSPPPMQIETPMVIPNPPTAAMPAPGTPTPLPPNAAALTPMAILGGVSRGALGVLAAGLIVVIMLLRRRR